MSPAVWRMGIHGGVPHRQGIPGLRVQTIYGGHDRDHEGDHRAVPRSLSQESNRRGVSTWVNRSRSMGGWQWSPGPVGASGGSTLRS